ncbi:hypothetical protein HDU85_001035 [Gaertneriomyces sp. JEL0708]|nr:hypothetical protein HDU85_001035 [Gaertneriomyces sp. JEL0708]
MSTTPDENVYDRLNPYAAAATLGDPSRASLFDGFDGLNLDDGYYEESSSFQEFVIGASSLYFARALASPFDIATILRQVQFLPSDTYLRRHSGSSADFRDLTPHDEDHADSDSAVEELDSSDDDDSDEQFADCEDQIERAASVPRGLDSNEKVAADVDGYLIPSRNSDLSRPPYQLAPLEGSTFKTIRSLVHCKDEGLLSLWKGNARLNFTNVPLVINICW